MVVVVLIFLKHNGLCGQVISKQFSIVFSMNTVHKFLCTCNPICVRVMCTTVTMHTVCEGLPTVTVSCTRNFTCLIVREKLFYMHENQCSQILYQTNPGLSFGAQAVVKETNCFLGFQNICLISKEKKLDFVNEYLNRVSQSYSITAQYLQLNPPINNPLL